MTAHGRFDRGDGRAFAELAAGPCASAAGLLLAAAAEFGPVDAAAAHDRLDSDARHLFGVAGRPPWDRAERLATTLDELGWRAGDEPDPAGLLLDRALVTRAAHPALLAGVGTELARRAGWSAAPHFSSRRWFVGLRDDEGAVILLDVRLRAGCATPPAQVRACCSHELAFCVLTGLVQAFVRRAQHDAARHAARLRLGLPIDDRLRATVRREIDALGGS